MGKFQSHKMGHVLDLSTEMILKGCCNFFYHEHTQWDFLSMSGYNIDSGN